MQISRERVAIQHHHNGKPLSHQEKQNPASPREPSVKPKISLLEENVSIENLLRRKYGKTRL